MQKSRKKLWITLAAVLTSVVLVCLMFGLLFRLKKVNVEFRNRASKEFTQLEEGVLENVKNSAEFGFGKNLLFMNFEENIAKIEKEHPFVKVEQVVRHFPNEVSVFISERTPRFRVKDKNSTNWFILDDDFKVLTKLTSAEVIEDGKYGNLSYEDITVEISSSSLVIEAFIGDFVTAKYDSNIKQIGSGILAAYNYKDIGKAKSISIKTEGTLEFEIVMKTSSTDTGDGCKIIVSGTDDLKLKTYSGLKLFISTLQENPTADLSNSTIIIGKNASGKYQATFKTNP